MTPLNYLVIQIERNACIDKKWGIYTRTDAGYARNAAMKFKRMPVYHANAGSFVFYLFRKLWQYVMIINVCSENKWALFGIVKGSEQTYCLQGLAFQSRQTTNISVHTSARHLQKVLGGLHKIWDGSNLLAMSLQSDYCADICLNILNTRDYVGNKNSLLKPSVKLSLQRHNACGFRNSLRCYHAETNE